MILNERMILLYCLGTALADGSEGAASLVGRSGHSGCAGRRGAAAGARRAHHARTTQTFLWETSMHASNTAAWRAKVREASDGIEAVRKELGTGRLHPETIIFAEREGSALILPTYLPISWPAKIAPKLCSISWRPFREPSDGLEPSTPSLPSQATGRNARQRFWLVFRRFCPQ